MKIDKFVQYLFLILFPFYPLWAWLSISLANYHIDKILILILIPIAIFYGLIQKVRFPKYLLFLSLFTVYHLASTFINDLMPKNTNWLFFILSDRNFLACFAFFVIENTRLDNKFISKMNHSIFIVVVITFIVSIIQIKNPTFFLNPFYTGLEYIGYLQQGRCFSIFNWVDLNSLGITFPIMISILLSINSGVKLSFPGAIIAGIIVSFLTKARYIMISAIIVFSQLFFTLKIDFRKKLYIILILIICIITIVGVAKIYDYDIQRVVDERILEKGTNMASANARVKSLEVFLVKFPEHPILGVGPATGADVVQLLQGVAPIIHVGYLSYLYFYGLVGFLILILSLFYLLKNAWIVGTKYMFWGSFYGLLAFCIANLTFVYFNLSEMGIILAVIYIKYFNDKTLSNPSTDEMPQVIPEENQESQ